MRRVRAEVGWGYSYRVQRRLGGGDRASATMWPWSSRHFDDRCPEHRVCRHCGYDLYGMPMEWRVFPQRARWLGRCVRCPECAQLNSLDVSLPKHRLGTRESIMWMIPATLIVLLGTWFLLWAAGVLLK